MMAPWDTPDCCTETLANGVRLAWWSRPEAHAVSLSAYVRCGFIYENSHNSGASHLLEHLHLAVTRRHATRLELLHALDALGGDVDATTWPDLLEFQFEMAPPCFSQGAELLGDVLEVRPFPDEIVEAEKHLVINELSNYTGDDVGEELRQALFGAQPYGLPACGTAHSVQCLPRDELAEFDAKGFAPPRIVVAAVGRLTSDNLATLRARLEVLAPSDTGELVLPELPTVALPFLRRKLTRRRGTGEIILGFAIPGSLAPDALLALSMLSMGLTCVSHPLFEKLRYGSGSTYAYAPGLELLPNYTLFYCVARPAERNREVFAREFLRGLSQTRAGESLDPWLSNVKRRYRFALERALDSFPTVARRIGAQEARSGWSEPLSISQEIERVEDMSPAQFLELIRQFLRRECFFLVVDRGKRSMLARVRADVDASFD
jgi:predicted Zn-dependent peptidase